MMITLNTEHLQGWQETKESQKNGGNNEEIHRQRIGGDDARRTGDS